MYWDIIDSKILKPLTPVKPRFWTFQRKSIIENLKSSWENYKKLLDGGDVIPFYINHMPYPADNIPSATFNVSNGSEILFNWFIDVSRSSIKKHKICKLCMKIRIWVCILYSINIFSDKFLSTGIINIKQK